ncbi:MAG: 3-dehydroquinate synthase [Planctomycetes bacterium]|nr:3-dehydroquinate synthase [Planctomycetota bacterium]
MHPVLVNVKLGSRSYDVAIGQNVLGHLAAEVRKLQPTSILMVSDTNVAPLHASALRAVLHEVAALHEFAVPAGEASKSAAQLEQLHDWALGGRIADRRSIVVALGGGVVGDLAGYFAATLMRGVSYVQVPTSLLAMVDSSVGGKVAINHAAGKNLIGAFHQPSAVVCELGFLKTLPDREYISALAEITKTFALTGDPELRRLFIGRRKEVLGRAHETMTGILEACVKFKARVVAADETENTGHRAILNLGHTLAHVLETEFPGRYLHGEAVSVGLAAAMRISLARAGLDHFDGNQILVLLQSLGLPVTVPPELTPQRTLELLSSDKKRHGATLNFVVLSALGKAELMPVKPDAAFVAQLLGAPRG